MKKILGANAPVPEAVQPGEQEPNKSKRQKREGNTGRKKKGPGVSSIGRYIAVIGVKPRLHACKAGTNAG